MLTLRLKSGEYVAIGDTIAVQVFRQKGNCFEVAVKAPREVPICRGEVYEQQNGKPDGLREHRTQSLSEKNANARQKATLARRADAVQQLYRVLDKMESRNPEWQQDILFMREQISRLNGESAT